MLVLQDQEWLQIWGKVLVCTSSGNPTCSDTTGDGGTVDALLFTILEMKVAGSDAHWETRTSAGEEELCFRFATKVLGSHEFLGERLVNSVCSSNARL